MHYCGCGTLTCAFFMCQIFLFLHFLKTVKSRFFSPQTLYTWWDGLKHFQISACVMWRWSFQGPTGATALACVWTGWWRIKTRWIRLCCYSDLSWSHHHVWSESPPKQGTPVCILLLYWSDFQDFSIVANPQNFRSSMWAKGDDNNQQKLLFVFWIWSISK